MRWKMSSENALENVLENALEYELGKCVGKCAGTPNYYTTTVQSTKTLIHAFISSHLDYCIKALLLGLPKYQLDRLQKVQNAAARVTFQIAKFHHITPALIDLHWLPVEFSSNCSFLFTSHYTTKVHPTLQIFYP